ncbi:MAG: nuclear transport factor 2 family protein [Salinivenus sp.]
MIRLGLVVACLLVGGIASERAASPVAAQPTPPSSDEEDVRALLEALFDGMRAGDSAAVRAVFHPDARLHTALGPSDTAAVRTTSVDAFVEAVGQPRERTWDERIWDVEVQVDGPLASAWVPYVFYRGDERSHCGVNAVQFIREADGWRILQLTDTRRTDCEVPPEVQK